MIVDCAVYSAGHRHDRPREIAGLRTEGREADGFAWVGLVEPTADEFEAVRLEFDLHELAVEDAITAHQRPKFETYGDTLFLVLKTARYVGPEEVVEIGEVMIFVGHDFVITVRHGAPGGDRVRPGDDAPAVRAQGARRPGRPERRSGALVPYFRDVADHIARVTDQVDSFGSLLTGVLQANLTQVSVRQNEDMRRISAWVAIIAVPTMVAGIYGMNFDHMPELRWRFGYPAVLLLILVVCFTLFRRFRRAGWL